MEGDYYLIDLVFDKANLDAVKQELELMAQKSRLTIKKEEVEKYYKELSATSY